MVKFKSMKRLVLFALVVTLVGCERKLIVEPNEEVYGYYEEEFKWYHTANCPSVGRDYKGEISGQKLSVRIDAEEIGKEPCPYCCFDDSEYASK